MEPTNTIVFILTIIFLASFALLLAPTFVDDSKFTSKLYALVLRASAIIACFLRGVLVPRIWINPHYLVVEFGVLVMSTIIFMAEYAPSPFHDPVLISFPVLWVIIALISFLTLEKSFFLAVQSSEIDLGYFGRLHRALWVLLGNLRVGVVTTMKGVAVALGSIAAAVAVFQAEEEVERAELADVEADAGGQAESETSSPPPYSYITPLKDVAFRDGERIV